MADDKIKKMIHDSEHGMTSIVKTIVRFVIGIIFVFGVYIILYGHLTPGGGFAGGVILACGYIILTLGFGKILGLKKLSDKVASVLDTAGVLVFLIIGLAGFTGGYFFLNFMAKGEIFHLASAGTIPLMNIAIGVKVTASIFAVFIALSIFGKFVSALGESSEENRKGSNEE
ncbi:MAG: hypothetical protein JW746_10145 [Candidatus Krumholzibacteriota bacterium]|nr:hypothetical protein [Candidatus Krumholzibacteriota bacterium]